jgi:hypothetical protein
VDLIQIEILVLVIERGIERDCPLFVRRFSLKDRQIEEVETDLIFSFL